MLPIFSLALGWHAAARPATLSTATAATTAATTSQRAARMAIEPLEVPQLAYRLREMAMVQPPPELGGLVALLVSRGDEVYEPGEADMSIHPYLVPLTRSPADGEVTALLRWPGSTAQLPLVRTNGTQLDLLATRVDHYVHRQAVEALTSDAADAADLAGLAQAVGVAWDPEGVANAPAGLDGALLTRVGPFAECYERLALGHLAKGSEQAALIACERSQACFQAWGRPFAFHARMLAGLGRAEEARDLARHALSLPLWTLSPMPLDEMLELGQTTREELRATLRLRADGNLPPEELQKNNGFDKRTPQEIAKDRATYLLDLAVAQPADYTYAEMRRELSELYGEAQMGAFATFVCPDESV